MAATADGATTLPTAVGRPLQEWMFDRAGDLQGWRANGHCADVEVEGGVLRCRTTGPDPILELEPRIDLAASPRQALEVRLRASRAGTAEFFWSNTDQGRFGGFTQEKTTRFSVSGDQQWHTYRLFPFWHPEGRLRRLRFDLYDGAAFEIDHVRVIEFPAPDSPPAAATKFDFTGLAHGWQRIVTYTSESGLGQGTPVELAEDSLWLSPPLDLDADELSTISLRIQARTPSRLSASGQGAQGLRATLLFATAKRYGWQSLSLPLDAGGEPQVYHAEMAKAPGWRGRVIAIGLKLPQSLPAREPGAAESDWQVYGLSVSDRPEGPAELRVAAFSLDEAVARAGRPTSLSALLVNAGGEAASNLTAELRPGGLALQRLTEPEASVMTPPLGPGEERWLRWGVLVGQPGTHTVELRLRASNARPVSAKTVLGFSARPGEGSVGYVPEPHPVRGPFEVGVYYFPGWQTASQWHPIRRFPERKPVLGWYREGNPEVADWHIKWAVEHGITFFAYDWYWSQGTRQLEHALHEGYFRARYRHWLKFCLLWANHNAPGTSSVEDSVAVTQYWIDQYFRRPEYLTIDGKPVVILFSPDRLTADLGSDGVRRALTAMREECARAGLRGLFVIACVGEVGQARQAAAESYDAVTAYNWPGLGLMTGELYAPYAALLEGYRRHWEGLREQVPIPLLLPLSGGWDSRPWHGENHIVRYGRTPALFAQHLRDARHYLERHCGGAAGPLPLVVVEAWNEFGEGSYIEPHLEYGFGYLDAIREVFTDVPPEHVDLTPADVGREPYEVVFPALDRTGWDFADHDQGWGSVMDLTDLGVVDGYLKARTTGNDPAWFGPPMQVPARSVQRALVRLRLRRLDGQKFNDTAQLFWRTDRLPESEATSTRFVVQGDGEWHDYHVPLAENPRWRGTITRLRLDPCNQRGVEVAVDLIRLEP